MLLMALEFDVASQRLVSVVARHLATVASKSLEEDV
jgi:hypothetical protein